MKGEGESDVQGREQVCLYPRLHGEHLCIASLMVNYNEINVWTFNIGKSTWSKYIKENKSQPKKSEVGFYLSSNTRINKLFPQITIDASLFTDTDLVSYLCQDKLIINRENEFDLYVFFAPLKLRHINFPHLHNFLVSLSRQTSLTPDSINHWLAHCHSMLLLPFLEFM